MNDKQHAENLGRIAFRLKASRVPMADPYLCKLIQTGPNDLGLVLAWTRGWKLESGNEKTKYFLCPENVCARAYRVTPAGELQVWESLGIPHWEKSDYTLTQLRKQYRVVPATVGEIEAEGACPT